MTAAPTILPWEKQVGESNPAWAAFVLYRDLGPERTLLKVSKQIAKNQTLVKRWSVRNNWIERCDEYDRYLDRRRREQEEEEWQIANSRHKAIGGHLTSAVLRRLAGHKETQVAPLDPNEMDWGDVSALARTAVQVDRLVHGQPTDFALRATTLSVTDALTHVKKLIELARRHMEPDAFQAFIADYAAYTGARLDQPPEQRALNP